MDIIEICGTLHKGLTGTYDTTLVIVVLWNYRSHREKQNEGLLLTELKDMKKSSRFEWNRRVEDVTVSSGLVR